VPEGRAAPEVDELRPLPFLTHDEYDRGTWKEK
jgi:hypothetical protein